jgi:hypothetical protein
MRNRCSEMGTRGVALLGVCAVLAACSSDAHDVDVAALDDGGIVRTKGDAGSAEPDAGNTQAGTGAAPAGGTGGTLPPPPPPPPTCEPCGPATGTYGTLPPCCTPEGRCGVDMSTVFGRPVCLEQSAPGGTSPVCADTPIQGFNIPGCCTRAGTCGLTIVMTLPLGCVDLAPYGGIGSLGIGGMTPALPTVAPPCAERPQ